METKKSKDRKAYLKAYKKTAKYREYHKKYMREYNRRESTRKKKRDYNKANQTKITLWKKTMYNANDTYKQIQLARSKTWYAVKTGKLVKESCECCGEMETQAHHDDYSKHLDIRWLCKTCHELWHIEHGDW